MQESGKADEVGAGRLLIIQREGFFRLIRIITVQGL
jgi:hypothetical protein